MRSDKRVLGPKERQGGAGGEQRHRLLESCKSPWTSWKAGLLTSARGISKKIRRVIRGSQR